MASTPNHAVQGAVLHYLALKLLLSLVALVAPVLAWIIVPYEPVLYTLAETSGALTGALPDIIGWLGRLVTPGDWTLYGEAHRGKIAGKLRYFPAYYLHILEDKLFHTPGNAGDWWPSLWYLEAAGWIISSLAVLYL